MANMHVGILVWFFSFLGVLALRIFIEGFISGKAGSVDEMVTFYLHSCLFFGLSFLLIWIFLSGILKISPKKAKNALFLAFWLVLLPPIIDMVKTGGQVFWSFYLLSDLKTLGWQFISFFGHLPSGIVYFGTKVVFSLAILLITAFVYVESRSVIKACLGAIFSYTSLFFMGSFPSWATFAYLGLSGGKKLINITSVDIVQLFGASAKIFGVAFGNFKYSFAHNLNIVFFLLLLGLLLILFFVIDRSKALAVVKNSRIPQIIYHSGLFFIGVGLGYLAYPENFNLNLFSVLGTLALLASVWLAWMASVVTNDIYDFEIDKISNPERPLQKNIFLLKEYQELVILFISLSILGGLVISLKFAALLFVYQFVAWVYSAEPFRLKRIPGLATFISAAASLVILFIGFTLISGDQNIQGLSWRIILLMLIALTLSLPIKDFKDIVGDKKYGVWTIPVLFGEEKGRLIVGVGVFISFISSVVLLNEFRLFWWALLSGIISFLIIISKKPRQLFWWVLGVVSIYGLILVKIVFLK